jgi:Tfp pilus assembly PilM family ATPase
MNKYRVGIEITDKKLQVAVVFKQKQLWRLMDTVAFPLQNGDNLHEILRKSCRALPGSIGHITLGIPYPQVLLKEIFVDPSLAPSEIYQYLNQQAAGIFGKPTLHWRLDFEPNPFTTNARNQVCYRAVAGPRETIETWQRIFRECGLTVSAIDVDVLALARLILTCEQYQPQQAQALLWVKPRELFFLVAQDGQMIYTKRAPLLSVQAFDTQLTSLLQFYNGLFPQYPLANKILLNENKSFIEDHSIKSASLNSEIWNTTKMVLPDEFCSLGLAIHEY